MTRNHLSKVIRRITGLTLPEFCAKYLNTNYKAFQYRARVKRLTPNEIILLSWVLDEPVEGLFGKQFISLMQGQGDPEIEKQLLKMYKDADENQKRRLMGLLDGISFKSLPAPEIKELENVARTFQTVVPLELKSKPDLGETVVPIANLIEDEDELQDTPEPTNSFIPPLTKSSEPQNDSDDFYVDVQVYR